MVQTVVKSCYMVKWNDFKVYSQQTNIYKAIFSLDNKIYSSSPNNNVFLFIVDKNTKLEDI